MALSFRWVGDEELDRVAETRMYSYAPAVKDLQRFIDGIRADRRGKSGDYLLAERDGIAVGTTTSLSLKIWVRGAPVACQGVAYVGTIKTHRRAGFAGQAGIATQLMQQTLRRARERNQIVSALMPFRASYYEHFGYGLVETRHEWTIPLSILPHGSCDGFSFVRSERDLRDMVACRQRMVESGQCDIERSLEAWEKYRKTVDEGYEVIDRGADGIVHGYLFFNDSKSDDRTYVRVADQAWDSLEALRRQLHFLASLRDQYSGAILHLPRDVPMNWLLRETQIPHRPVEHAVPRLAPYTRMQVRILDHRKFLEALCLPRDIAGHATVAVHECEHTVSKFRIDLSEGRCQVSASDASADVELSDKLWAAVACGELSATQAARFDLLKARNIECLRVLDALSVGPAPFCAEYF